MRELVFTKESVNDYYKKGFSGHLQRYFEITGFERRQEHSIILHPADVRGVPRDPTGQMENNFIFSGLVMYMILIPQAINAICGKDQLWDFKLVRDFYLASGWPEFSAGLGGPYADVRRFLRESQLYPSPEESLNFVNMLKTVSPFMREEICRFLLRVEPANLNNDAYDRLCQNVDGHVEEISKWLEGKVKEFCDEIKSVEVEK